MVTATEWLANDKWSIEISGTTGGYKNIKGDWGRIDSQDIMSDWQKG